ncbi:MAG: hypothetical protein K0R64_1128 [Novosphingobium lindaniclasticum]|jgi:hypothetical protein|nr:hypothetical protein [Novosphingobium lindaniclasticum]
MSSPSSDPRLREEFAPNNLKTTVNDGSLTGYGAFNTL